MKFMFLVSRASRRAALFVVSLAALPAMAATTYYVGGNNASDDNDGSSGAPFATIAKAASMVAAGDTIQIADGRYVISSPVEIALANVTVAGAGREAVVIDGQSVWVVVILCMCFGAVIVREFAEI